MTNFKDLSIWQRSMDLSIAVYELTDEFPAEERYGLVSQMRRAVVSISSNIAEGKNRGTQKDFRRFLFQAYGSGGELETQILIAKRWKKTKDFDYSNVDILLSETMRMLNVFIRNMGV